LLGVIKEAMNVISDMAKGKAAFDAVRAEAARAAVEDAASRIPAAFEEPETDPKSEALPAIWENWGKYVDASDALIRAASRMDVSTLDSLRSTLPEVGGTCRGCHKPFRVKK
jgi:cytochrome c556